MFLAWLIAIIAMTGSLYFSQIVGLTPCVLCWYQRIAMYPLVIVLALALWRQEETVIARYVLPLALLGGAIALFHWLLQLGIIPDAAAPCSAGVSCTTRFIVFGGFVTIPLLSLVAFSLISAASYTTIRSKRHPTKKDPRDKRT